MKNPTLKNKLNIYQSLWPFWIYTPHKVGKLIKGPVFHYFIIVFEIDQNFTFENWVQVFCVLII